MAIARQHQTDVGTSATQIAGTEYPSYRLINNGATVVFLGGSDVTTANGYPLAVDAEFFPTEMAHQSLRGHVGDRLYGIVATGTEDVRVLVEGRVNP